LDNSIIALKVLFEKIKFQRPRPLNYSSVDNELFRTHEQSAWPIYYDVLHNVSINHELFVKRNLKILPLSFGHPWQNEKYNTPFYLLKNGVKNLLRKDVKVDSVLWILDQFSTGGYYHWFTEILPRLWVANEVQELPLDIPIYLPEYFFHKWSFGPDLLRPFKREYRKFKPSNLLKVSNMHFISQPGGPLAFQPKPLMSSTKVLLDYYYRSDYKNGCDKIYISRNRGNKRLLTNEAAILPNLKKRGFKIVYTEELNVEEQINLFSRAKVLVSIHGAGMTNMVFMKSNSIILEIRNPLPDHMNNCFLALADTLGHRYHYFLGSMKQKRNEKRPIDYSLSVDVESFESSLDKLNI